MGPVMAVQKTLYKEVYSWAAHQPAKSLVRAHLRMAVNKPQRLPRN